MPKPWKERLGAGREPAEQPRSDASTSNTPDARDVALLAAEIGSAPQLDLHGLSVADALRALDQFLNQQLVAGGEAVRVIYGLGEGRLRAAVLDWLEAQHAAHGLVAAYRESSRPGEHGAVVIVALERITPELR